MQKLYEAVNRVKNAASFQIISPRCYLADTSDRRSSTLVEERKKQGVRGEKAHLQMARVGVYWQEDQNTSVVSRGTRATHCDWPDGSQEPKPRSLQYNRGWRERKRDR